MQLSPHSEPLVETLIDTVYRLRWLLGYPQILKQGIAAIFADAITQLRYYLRLSQQGAPRDATHNALHELAEELFAIVSRTGLSNTGEKRRLCERQLVDMLEYTLSWVFLHYFDFFIGYMRDLDAAPYFLGGVWC